MNPTILPLEDPRADLATVGGKGISLAKLAVAGLPVPGGFHVTTQAYRQFVAENHLQEGIRAALQAADPSRPATLEDASGAIARLFAQAPIPTPLAEAIREAYAALPGPDPAVAVRSSATAEDLPDASFAGQQETYLNIRGTQQVLEAVRRCWASLWTARAIGYRARQGISADDVALAVVVQRLVCADAAGILFTANPLNGRRDEVVINASWGLGEAVVGGLVTPDTLTVRKSTGQLVSREIAEKRVMTVRTPEGVTEQEVPEGLRSVPVLSDEKASELARIGSQIETLYGMPLDIEWALADGAFAILQARPVTALPEAPLEWTRPNPKYVYMRTSVVDLMPAPLSPLYATLGIPALLTQMYPVGKKLTGTQPVLSSEYLTTINRFAYMSSSFPLKAWWWIITGLMPSMITLFGKVARLWRTDLLPAYQAAVAGMPADSPAQMTANALWSQIRQLMDSAAYYVSGLLFATMGAAAGGEALTTQAYNRWAKRAGDPDASTLLMGWDNIPARSEKSLYDLAQWALKDDALAAYLLETPSAEIAGRLETPQGSLPAGFAAFRERFQTHLKQFGHIVFQLDIAEPLAGEKPEIMLETIRLYLRGQGSDPYARQRAAETRRIETTRVALSRAKGLKGWGLRTALNWGQSLAEVREDALAEIGLAYPRMRALLHELGVRMVAAGGIRHPADIFWLEKEEVDACVERLERGQHLDDLSGQVEERKAFNRRAAQVTPPAMIPMKKRVMGIKTDVIIPHLTDDQQAGMLKGVAASAGVVTAPARVLHGPEDFDQMRPGEVLVAATTTPAWTPLFAMASAVVTDIGGPLSHGSIVAREYGIPAVMGTRTATHILRSGQIITVDGTQGEVRLETAPDGSGEAATPMVWKPPDPRVSYARGSLAEHTPSPVSPLFATLGLRIANEETFRLWEGYARTDPTSMFGAHGFYVAVNRYVYGGFHLGLKETWQVMKMSFSQLGPALRGSVERRSAGREVLAAEVAAWEQKDLSSLSPGELLEGVRSLFRAAVKYFTVIQTTLPAASIAEILFGRYYNALARRKGDPEYTTLLFGYDTAALRAEKSLFDIAAWLRDIPELAGYVERTPTEQLAADWQRREAPAGLPEDAWIEWRDRFDEHFEQFGRTAYEFDFANPTPAESPAPQFEAVRQFLLGMATNPYERHQAAAARREQAEQAILKRLRWPVKDRFIKLLREAQATAPVREDSITDLGMAHPLIRRMLAELGGRLAAADLLPAAEDVYWLEEAELEVAVVALENGQEIPTLDGLIPARKAEWRAALRATPPIALPEKSFWMAFFAGSGPKQKNGKTVLKGLGTSAGQVTAPACVLNGPEDFSAMRPGDVLVATTTTPAWTPLFAMASAVVTDIGGPLSHSSIVAREYGIPAVMGARDATRTIRSGQMVLVDGKAGTVTLL